MSLNRGDRDNVNAMHQLANGTGTLEASRKRSPIVDSGRPNLWKNTPSVIQVPSSSRHPRSSAHATRSFTTNPYPQSNFNNLPRVNPSARALVPNTLRSDTPSAKKRKLGTPSMAENCKTPAATKSRRRTIHSSTGSASITLAPDKTGSTSGHRSSNGHMNTFKTEVSVSDDLPPLSTPTTRVVIDLEEEEDLGKPVLYSYARFVPLTPSTSSDDLQLITPRHSNDHADSPSCSIGKILGVGKPSDQHAFSRIISSHDIKSPPPAGPHTSALKAQLTDRGHAMNGAENDEMDLIEDADEFDNPPIEREHPGRKTTSSVPKHVVSKNVNYFESITRPPEIDLKKRKRVGSMKSKFIPSTTQGGHAFFPGKPPASTRRYQSPHTPPSPSLTAYKTTNDRHKQYVFPLEACAYGSRILESVNLEEPTPKLWIRVQTPHISIVQAPIESGHVVASLDLEKDILNAQFPRNGATTANFPLLIFTLVPTNRAIQLFTRKKDFGNQEHVIILKPLTSHQNWSATEFHKMCDDLKSKAKAKGAIACVDVAAFRAQWDSLRNPQGNAPADQPHSQVARRRPQPRPTYAGAAQTSPASTSSGVRSQRETTSNNPPSHSPSPPGDDIILLYPPTGTGAVNVTNGDLKRLEPGEFLNDTLIELGLKLWLHDLRCQRPEFADQVHVFSSFFYTQLNQKNLEEGYQSVRKWTSRFDLFQKKYIIVPINEHLHWYLAIICHPELVLQHPPALQVMKPNVTTRRAQESLNTKTSLQGSILAHERSTSTRAHKPKASPASLMTSTEDEQEVERAVHVCPATPRTRIPSRPTSPSSSVSSMTAQPDNEVGAMEIVPATDSEGEHNAMTLDVSMEPGVSPQSASAPLPRIPPVPSKYFYGPSESPRSKSRNAMQIVNESEEEQIDQLQHDDTMDVDTSPYPAVEQEQAKQEQPYIFSFDSLGTRHPHALKVLSRYLDMEAKDKKGWGDIVQPVIRPASVPAQPNYCDCGVYLLHFVEQFMSDPETFSQQILQQKSKRAVGSDKSARERLWSHDKIAGKREEMKDRIISLSVEWRREKQADVKGKGRDQIEDQPKEIGTKNIEPDSDIEVVEIDPKPIRNPNHSRINKAARIR